MGAVEREDDGDENAKKQKMDDAKNEGRDGAAKMEEDDINDDDKEKDRWRVELYIGWYY